MKSKLIYIAVFLVLILSLVPVALTAPSVQADTMHVGAGQTYETIQAAIDAAADYDTILVYDGTYEENILVDKPLTIVSVNGNASTVINGTAGEDQFAVSISAGNVTFGAAGQGFSVTNMVLDAMGIVIMNNGDDGIADISVQGNHIYECSLMGIVVMNNGNGDITDVTIEANHVHDCEGGMGIIIMNGGSGDISGFTVQGNYVHDCGGGIEGEGGGIALGNVGGAGNLYDNLVTSNEVYNCNIGIALLNTENVEPASIYGNTIENNVVHMTALSIALVNFNDVSSIMNNHILNNEIYDSAFCVMLSGEGGNLYGNTISGNTVYDSFIGVTLGEIAGFSGINIDSNIVEDNEIYNCGGGVYLGLEVGSGSLSGNNVVGNDIHDIQPVESTTGSGIILSNAGSGNVVANTLHGNIVYKCVAGIDIQNNGTGSTLSNTVKGNTVYGCDTGISLSRSDGENSYNSIWNNTTYDEISETGNDVGIIVGDGCLHIDVSGNDIGFNAITGLEIDSADWTHVTANFIHNNSEGIYIYDAHFAHIYGNNIRDNHGPTTGIYVNGSDQIDVRCNNIVGNGVGIEAQSMTINVSANWNWWGDPSGPGGNYGGAGDEVYGDVDIDISSWLSQEHVLNTAAVPPTISLDDTDGTDLTVEQQVDVGCCYASSVEADLRGLLLDLLPADFVQRYVSTWDEGSRNDWEDWLDELAGTAMTYDEENGSWHYELDLQSLLDDGLMEFFTYTGGDEDYDRLISEELRAGDFQIPAYISNGGCGTYFTAFIPLTITTSGPTPTPTPTPSPTPTPTPTRRPGGGGYIPPEQTPAASPSPTPPPSPTATPAASPSPPLTPAPTAEPALGPTPTGASTATPTFTPTPAPAEGEGNWPDRLMLIILVAAGAVLLAGLTGAIMIRVRK